MKQTSQTFPTPRRASARRPCVWPCACASLSRPSRARQLVGLEARRRLFPACGSVAPLLCRSGGVRPRLAARGPRLVARPGVCAAHPQPSVGPARFGTTRQAVARSSLVPKNQKRDSSSSCALSTDFQQHGRKVQEEHEFVNPHRPAIEEEKARKRQAVEKRKR